MQASEPSRGPVTRPVPLFYNPVAGVGGERMEREFAEALLAGGVEAALHPMPPEALGGAVRRAAEGGAGVVVVAGGDGTVSSAAEELVGRSTVLGVIPVGTRNHFARRLGIEDVESAVAVLARGRVTDVAVGEVNGQVFVNNASCGLYPHLVRHREVLRRWLGKWPAAVVASGMVARRLPLLEVELVVDGERLARRTPVVWVGIGQGSFRFPERSPAQADARVLEVVVARPQSRWALATLAARALLRSLRADPAAVDRRLLRLSVEGFKLAAREPIDIALDGEELRLDPPLVFRLREGSLRVLTPVVPMRSDR